MDVDSRALAYRASLHVATELVQSDAGGIVEGDSQMEVVEGLDNREEVAFANRVTSKTRSGNRLMAFIRTVNSLDGNAVPEGDDFAVEDAETGANARFQCSSVSQFGCMLFGSDALEWLDTEK